MKRPAQKSYFARLIGALVVMALMAAAGKLIYYAWNWRELVSDTASFSWMEWGVAAAFTTWLVWRRPRK